MSRPSTAFVTLTKSSCWRLRSSCAISRHAPISSLISNGREAEGTSASSANHSSGRPPLGLAKRSRSSANGRGQRQVLPRDGVAFMEHETRPRQKRGPVGHWRICSIEGTEAGRRGLVRRVAAEPDIWRGFPRRAPDDAVAKDHHRAKDRRVVEQRLAHVSAPCRSHDGSMTGKKVTARDRFDVAKITPCNFRRQIVRVPRTN